MEERIEKTDGLTVETLQQQVDMLQDQVRNLNEEVLSLNEDLKEANKYRQMYSDMWCEERGRVERFREVYKATITVFENLTMTAEAVDGIRKIFTNVTIREA